MRINVYSQELTDEVIRVEKISNTGRPYVAAQLILHSSSMLHHPPQDDDRSAVSFWLPSSRERCEMMAKAFDRIADIFRSESGLLCKSCGVRLSGDARENCGWCLKYLKVL
jgi:hypothetical protein